jgi:hypothetical protein
VRSVALGHQFCRYFSLQAAAALRPSVQKIVFSDEFGLPTTTAAQPSRAYDGESAELLADEIEHQTSHAASFFSG